MRLKLRLLPFLLLLLAARLPVHADLVENDSYTRVPVQVQLLNAHEYPGYKFYFQPGSLVENAVWEPVMDSTQRAYLLPGKATMVSEDGEHMHLFAEDSQGNVFRSDTLLGGEHVLDYDAYQQFIHQIRVIGIADGVIRLKTVALVEKDQNGKVLQVRKGALGTQAAMGIWAIPLVSLLGLIAFFLLRRRVAAIPRRP